jgi:hypothetical protein
MQAMRRRHDLGLYGSQPPVGDVLVIGVAGGERLRRYERRDCLRNAMIESDLLSAE